MAKLMQILERRRNAKHRIGGANPTQAPAGELFPNGEKAAIIRAIHDLQDQREADRRVQNKICARLGIDL